MLSALAGQFNGAKTLILQHRDELVEQNMTKFQKVNPSINPGLFTASTKSWRGKATFAMIQTLCRPKNIETMPAHDLVIVDEAHHVAAETYQRILNACKDRNDNVMIAGFTATPSRGDGKGLRSFFNNVADHITLQELIQKGFLVHPRAFVIDVEGVRDGLSRVRKLASDYDMEQVAEVMNRKVVNDCVVEQWREKAGDRRTIIFCSTIAHAQDVLNAFRDAGISAEMVTGETPDRERKGMLRRLSRGETQVIVNCAVLTEGFDEPSVSCIVLLRPCSYKSTMIQMIGRGLRPIMPGDYPGLIKRDCIILDFGTSILTHGDIEAGSGLGQDDSIPTEPGAASIKTCPKDQGGCGAVLPAAVRYCPLCGYEFLIEEEEEARRVVLTEIDLMAASPFCWVDLFGSGKVMIASGFGNWAGIFSRNGEDWYALGKAKESRVLSKLVIGDRIQAMAAADDFLRQTETADAANKSRRWLKDPATEKQMELLKRCGYQDDLGFGFTKYTATGHLNFQWNRALIERALQ